MRDKWCDPSSDFLRGYSPLRNPEVDDRMDDERQDDHEKNLERPDTVAIIPSHHACEPESEE